jgi:predicted DNA-binding protein with PD1-like motif
MKSRKIDDGWLLRLEKGDEVVADATIGIFDREKKEYFKKTFEDDLEVGNLTANVSYLDDGEPFVHCHITLSDSSLKAFTGHLFKATVTITLEVYIRVFSEKLERKEDPMMGFKFWQL